ncbi:PaaI family thioesterase [Cellulomonas sp. PhB143]|uniref:PaaI family thioesterase n=1 Tax=Cellulomonas sp. PhB143 TaxID=2485186 RepID=UPI000F476A5D|nr:PaaI family thioesterase [Cellulomonas sp. PhB143]ROS72102.1 uncharacterized protein (TIGR00369 family) [Cellulomonas sp. PhB143]
MSPTSNDATPAPAPSTRNRTVEWHDPLATAGRAQEVDGLTFLQEIVDGTIPPPPIANLMNMRFTAVEHGSVTFELDPDASQYNPIGTVHGGVLCTLLDSVAACALHTTLPRGTGYTSVEIKVSFLRAVTTSSGTLTATGTVTKPGRRVAFAEGQVHDAAGRLVATASTTLLVFPLEA